jgi:hypothetical protein
MTWHDKLEIGLTVTGWVKDSMDRSRYTAFKNPNFPNFKLFIGKAGALRKGANASSSFSLGDPNNITPMYQRILNAADQAIKNVMEGNVG